MNKKNNHKKEAIASARLVRGTRLAAKQKLPTHLVHSTNNLDGHLVTVFNSAPFLPFLYHLVLPSIPTTE